MPHYLNRFSAVVALSLVTACQTPEEHAASADKEVYALLASRRAEFSSDPDSFEIVEDPNSLRKRLLAGEAAPTEPIGLTEVLLIASENSREFQDKRERLYLTALDLTMERWRLGWIPSGSMSVEETGLANTTAEVNASTDFGLSKFFGDGGQIIAGIGVDLWRLLSSGSGEGSAGVLSLTITQPLLTDVGRRIMLEPLTQAERDLVYEVRAYERFRRTFAVDVASRYYQVLRMMDAAKNAELNYTNLATLADRNRALAKAGRLDDLQLDQVKQDELRSEDRLLSAKASLRSSLDEFKYYLGLPIGVELVFDSAALDRFAEEAPVAVELEEDSLISVAMASRLDYLTILDELEDAERRVEISEDALRAGLDFVASSSTSSAERKPGKFEFDDTSWSLGLALDLPIDQLPERNAYRSSLISRDATRRSAEAFGDSIRVSLRDALREAETAFRTYNIQLESVSLAERRVESTNLRLEAGRAEIRDILEAQEALLESRNSVTNSLVEFQLAKLTLYRDTEHLEVGEGGISIRPIELEDPQDSGARGQ
jgi:outer membrane protein TolC